MAVQTREYLKTRFEHLDQPTEQDFQDLIDTMIIAFDDFVVHEGAVVCHQDEVVSL